MRRSLPPTKSGAIAVGPLALLPRPLLRAEQPLIAIGVGWLTAFIPSIMLALLAATLFPSAEKPQFNVDGLTAIFALVIFAPVVETLIMAAVLGVLQMMLRPATAVLVSAAGWGIAHSLAAPTWGLVIWWPFLVFSTLFVVWRQRSLWLALAMPMAVHALQNLPPALAIASGNA